MDDGPGMRHLPNFGLPDVFPTVDAWESIRRPTRHSDGALTGTARLWLRKLPAGRRPLQLCHQFPRVANLIAWHWRDPVLTHEVLDDLLADRRGGRQGFPKTIAWELRRLRDFIERRGETEPGPGYMEALRRFWSKH